MLAWSISWCKQFSFSMSETGMRDKSIQWDLILLSHWPLKCHFIFRKTGLFVASFFEFVRIERCYLNITYEKKSSSRGPSLYYFLHKCKMKFLTISYIKERCYAYKTYTKILLHIRNHNILQYTILRQLLRHVASLLGNN